MSVDPLGFAAGDTNLARYIGNSPTNATDSSGLYREDGHFYTVFAVARLAGWDAEDAFRLAYHAQLPDENPNFEALPLSAEAIALALPAVAERAIGVRGAGREAVECATSINKGIHSLHGENVEKWRNKLRELLKLELARGGKDIWKVGFMIHAFGDSYAHSHRSISFVETPPRSPFRNVRPIGIPVYDSKLPTQSYDWEFGHFLDGTTPDLIRGDSKTEAKHRKWNTEEKYASYVQDLYVVLGGKGNPLENENFVRFLKDAKDTPHDAAGAERHWEKIVGLLGYKWAYRPFRGYSTLEGVGYASPSQDDVRALADRIIRTCIGSTD